MVYLEYGDDLERIIFFWIKFRETKECNIQNKILCHFSIFSKEFDGTLNFWRYLCRYRYPEFKKFKTGVPVPKVTEYSKNNVRVPVPFCISLIARFRKLSVHYVTFRHLGFYQKSSLKNLIWIESIQINLESTIFWNKGNNNEIICILIEIFN